MANSILSPTMTDAQKSALIDIVEAFEDDKQRAADVFAALMDDAKKSYLKKLERAGLLELVSIGGVEHGVLIAHLLRGRGAG